jgi:uncharacterized membrane protein
MDLGGMAFRFLVYGALGWCGEILWTALTRRIRGTERGWRLVGDTSLWAFPMYGAAVLLYEPVHNLMLGQFILIRAGVYLLGFWLVEYLGGWVVWKISGIKPWDYSASPGGSLNGLIRWNFVLVWPLIGLLAEPLHAFLVRITPAVLSAMR